MIVELKNALSKGVVNVTFTKTNGETRNMRATTNTNLFHYTPKGGSRPSRPGVTVMWDMDKGEFRSMRDGSLVSFTAE